MAKRKRRKNKRNQQTEETYIESDEHFAFIAGYTSGGFPFGITWEEWEEDKLKGKKYIRNNNPIDISDEDLPF